MRKGRAFVANGKAKCETTDEVINNILFIGVLGMEFLGEGRNFQWGLYGIWCGARTFGWDRIYGGIVFA